MKKKQHEALHRKAILAMKKAVRMVIEEHRQAGRPLAVWRRGKLVLLSPYRIRLTRRKSSS